MSSAQCKTKGVINVKAKEARVTNTAWHRNISDFVQHHPKQSQVNQITQTHPQRSPRHSPWCTALPTYHLAGDNWILTQWPQVTILLHIMVKESVVLIVLWLVHLMADGRNAWVICIHVKSEGLPILSLCVQLQHKLYSISVQDPSATVCDEDREIIQEICSKKSSVLWTSVHWVSMSSLLHFMHAATLQMSAFDPFLSKLLQLGAIHCPDRIPGPSQYCGWQTAAPTPGTPQSSHTCPATCTSLTESWGGKSRSNIKSHTTPH